MKGRNRIKADLYSFVFLAMDVEVGAISCPLVLGLSPIITAEERAGYVLEAVWTH